MNTNYMGSETNSPIVPTVSDASHVSSRFPEFAKADISHRRDENVQVQEQTTTNLDSTKPTQTGVFRPPASDTGISNRISAKHGGKTSVSKVLTENGWWRVLPQTRQSFTI